jgi:hypothetical protein
MSRVFCAKSLAHVAGKGSAEDHESECERKQASSHLRPSIPNRHLAPSWLMELSPSDGRTEATADSASSLKSLWIAELENSLLLL